MQYIEKKINLAIQELHRHNITIQEFRKRVTPFIQTNMPNLLAFKKKIMIAISRHQYNDYVYIWGIAISGLLLTNSHLNNFLWA